MLNAVFGRLRGDLWYMPGGFCITHLLESPWDEDSWELRGPQDAELSELKLGESRPTGASRSPLGWWNQVSLCGTLTPGTWGARTQVQGRPSSMPAA